MEKSALSMRMKMETLGNEVFRRLYNTRSENEDRLMGEIVSKLMLKMRSSLVLSLTEVLIN